MTNPFVMRTLAFALALSGLFSAATLRHVQAQPLSRTSEKEGHDIARGAVTPQKIELKFKSTLEQFKPYRDEKMSSWKGANDEVGRIGGWRAYLKEANEPDATEVVPGKSNSSHTQPAATGTVRSEPSTNGALRPAPIQNPSPAPHSGHGRK